MDFFVPAIKTDINIDNYFLRSKDGFAHIILIFSLNLETCLNIITNLNFEISISGELDNTSINNISQNRSCNSLAEAVPNVECLFDVCLQKLFGYNSIWCVQVCKDAEWWDGSLFTEG